MAKINKDGLVGGALVSEQDHLRVVTLKRKAMAKQARKDAEKAAEIEVDAKKAEIDRKSKEKADIAEQAKLDTESNKK